MNRKRYTVQQEGDKLFVDSGKKRYYNNPAIFESKFKAGDQVLVESLLGTPLAEIRNDAFRPYWEQEELPETWAVEGAEDLLDINLVHRSLQQKYQQEGRWS